MKAKSLCIGVLVSSTYAIAAAAAEVDPRFEGFWVGTETFQVAANVIQKGEAPFQKPAVIAIGDRGKMLAVVEGLYPGRYAVSPEWLPSYRRKSEGNTLVFALMNRPIKPVLIRDACKLVLSPDGNTITESGQALLPSQNGGGEPGQVVQPTNAFYFRLANISGTFHRQKK